MLCGDYRDELEENTIVNNEVMKIAKGLKEIGSKEQKAEEKKKKKDKKD